MDTKPVIAVSCRLNRTRSSIRCFSRCIPVVLLLVSIQSHVVYADVTALVRAANNAKDQKELGEVLRSLQTMSNRDVAEYVRLASRNTNGFHNCRLVAAIAISLLDDSEKKTLIRGFLADESIDVKRAAWLAVKATFVDADTRLQALRSPDQTMRAIVVSRSEDKSRVASFCYDPSPFVRTVALRRLLKIGDPKESVVRNALARCLVDHHQLVRSNALLMAQHARYLPSATIVSGLITDARTVVMLEDVLANGEDSLALRELLQLPTEVDLGLAYFHSTLCLYVAPPVSLSHPRMPGRLGESRLIGPAAADIAIQLGVDGIQDILQNVIESQFDTSSDLGRQLIQLKMSQQEDRPQREGRRPE